MESQLNWNTSRLLEKIRTERMSFSDTVILVLGFALSFAYLNTFETEGHLLPTILCLLWYLVVLVFNPQARKLFSSKSFCFLYGFLLVFLISYTVGRGFKLAFVYLVHYFALFSPIVLFEVFKNKSRRVISIALIVFTSIMVYNIINGFVIMTFLGDGHGLKNVMFMDDVYFKKGYELANSLPVLVIALTYILKNHRMTTISKFVLPTYVFLIALLALVVVFIFRAYYTTPLLITIIFVIIVLFVKKGKDMIIGGAAIGFFLIMFVVNFDEIRKLSNSTEGSEKFLTPRLEEVYYILTGKGHKAEDVGSRSDMTWESLETFITDPLTGVMYKTTSFDDEVKYGVGRHAEWQDNLAKYGIWATFLFAFIYLSLKRYYNFFRVRNWQWVFLVLGFLNPVLFFWMTFITFCYVPLLYIAVFRPNKIA